MPCNDWKNADGNNSIVQDDIENAGGVKAQHEGVRFVHTSAFSRHGSKYIIYGPGCYLWEHSVPSGRGERAPITFRSWLGPNLKKNMFCAQHAHDAHTYSLIYVCDKKNC